MPSIQHAADSARDPALHTGSAFRRGVAARRRIVPPLSRRRPSGVEPFPGSRRRPEGAGLRPATTPRRTATRNRATGSRTDPNAESANAERPRRSTWETAPDAPCGFRPPAGAGGRATDGNVRRRRATPPQSTAPDQQPQITPRPAWPTSRRGKAAPRACPDDWRRKRPVPAPSARPAGRRGCSRSAIAAE